MGNLFGRKDQKKSRITEQDRAVLQLKQQRDKLKQYQQKIIIQLAKDRTVARELMKNGKKEKAKLLLRKKKFQEGIMEKTDSQLDNIEIMVQDIEFAQVESKVIEGLKNGNESLKKMHEVMSLEDVEKIMGETAEAVEYQREIDELISGSLTQQDEDDVLSELDNIMQESLPDVPVIDEALELPSVPLDKIEQKGNAEDGQKKKVALSAS